MVALEKRTSVLRTLLCVASFLAYASAVLIQGQYRASFWGSDNYTQVSGAVAYAAHGTPFATTDSQVKNVLMTTLNEYRISTAVLQAAQPGVAGGQVEIAKDGVGVGYLIFTSLSMKAFGVHIDAIPLGMLVLLGLSVLAFLARFDDRRLLALPLLFLVLTLVLITPISTDPFTRDGLPVGGSRYMGVIAMLPTIHILWELFELPPAVAHNNWRNVLLLLVQTVLLAFAILVRGATIYLLVALGAFSLLLCLIRRHRVERLKIFKIWAALAASTAAVFTVVMVSVPSEYVSTGRLVGNFWHRVFISTSVSRAWPYGELRAMFPCTNAYPEGLGPRFDSVGYCAWFAAHPDYHPTLEQRTADERHHFFDDAYERIMRDAFFKVVRAYPREIFDTFVYEKSKLIYSTLLQATAMAVPGIPPGSGPGRARLSDVSALVTRATPFVVLQFMIFVACSILFRVGAPEMARFSGMFASFFLLSLLPLYAVYSYMYVSLDMVVYMYALFIIAALQLAYATIAGVRKFLIAKYA